MSSYSHLPLEFLHCWTSGLFPGLLGSRICFSVDFKCIYALVDFDQEHTCWHKMPKNWKAGTSESSKRVLWISKMGTNWILAQFFLKNSNDCKIFKRSLTLPYQIWELKKVEKKLIGGIFESGDGGGNMRDSRLCQNLWSRILNFGIGTMYFLVINASWEYRLDRVNNLSYAGGPKLADAYSFISRIQRG